MGFMVPYLTQSVLQCWVVKACGGICGTAETLEYMHRYYQGVKDPDTATRSVTPSESSNQVVDDVQSPYSYNATMYLYTGTCMWPNTK